MVGAVGGGEEGCAVGVSVACCLLSGGDPSEGAGSSSSSAVEEITIGDPLRAALGSGDAAAGTRREACLVDHVGREEGSLEEMEEREEREEGRERRVESLVRWGASCEALYCRLVVAIGIAREEESSMQKRHQKTCLPAISNSDAVAD